MGNVEKIVENINLPKQILDKSEALLKTLFGQAFDELGGMIADQVRLRRFKAEIKIFQKAQDILKKKGINPKNVSLKVLAPLIEYSSYEEDESLQEKWANLISNILTKDLSVVLQQNSISILNKISNHDASIIDYMHKQFLIRRKTEFENKGNQHEEWVKNGGKKLLEQLEEAGEDIVKIKKDIEFAGKVEDYKLDDLSFKIEELGKKFDLSESDIELSISNLVALGLVKMETKVEPSNTYFDVTYDKTFDLSIDVNDFENVKFTKLGFEFAELCNT